MLGLTELELDVWVAGDGTIRRLAFSIDDEAAGGAPGGLTTTFELYGVGEPVEVDVPSGPTSSTRPNCGPASSTADPLVSVRG